MANKVIVSVKVELRGDGSSLTAMLVLDATPLYTSSDIINYKVTPDSVSLIRIRDEYGNTVPASAALAHNGKQVTILFPTPFTGLVTVTLHLEYDV